MRLVQLAKSIEHIFFVLLLAPIEKVIRLRTRIRLERGETKTIELRGQFVNTIAR